MESAAQPQPPIGPRQIPICVSPPGAAPGPSFRKGPTPGISGIANRSQNPAIFIPYPVRIGTNPAATASGGRAGPRW